MSHKKQHTEVYVSEEEKDGMTILKLKIGQKEIGEIMPKNARFEVKIDESKETTVRSIDEGIEYLIARYNLQI